MKYHILCTKCKGKRTNDAETLGMCMEQAEKDGWRVNVKETACGNCKDIHNKAIL